MMKVTTVVMRTTGVMTGVMSDSMNEPVSISIDPHWQTLIESVDRKQHGFYMHDDDSIHH